ncbi:MAG TPA: GNAT family N-acetyltransferase [Chloroflexaceae bacterium]|nr:GNAT family N-acetyltransferase [Chloroflexaceae bacterium]
MSSESPEPTMRDNQGASRYEADLGGDQAVLVYALRGQTIVMSHTEVPEALEGRGIGSALARFALDDARARELRVVPRCPFVAAFIKRHPEYADLVAGG